LIRLRPVELDKIGFRLLNFPLHSLFFLKRNITVLAFIGTIIPLILLREGFNMNQDFWIASYVTLSVIIGGVLARLKGDYVTRGMTVAFLTGIFGIITIIISSSSNARKCNEYDIHQWPAHAQFAVLGQLVFVLILLIAH
jgi:hypothetical protein